MFKVTALKTAGALAIGLLLAAPPSLAADEAQSDQKTETTVMYLGKTPIVGDRNIFLTLQSIKVALMRPYSSKASDSDLVVCRINRAMSEALEYLDCDTNRDYTQLRDMSQMAFLSAQGQAGRQSSQSDFDSVAQVGLESTIVFEHLINVQPNHRLHIPINGGNLRKLLDSLPMPSPDQTTAAPAAASSTGGG